MIEEKQSKSKNVNNNLQNQNKFLEEDKNI
jgi:hypothetical protein